MPIRSGRRVDSPPCFSSTNEALRRRPSSLSVSFCHDLESTDVLIIDEEVFQMFRLLSAVRILKWDEGLEVSSSLVRSWFHFFFGCIHRSGPVPALRACNHGNSDESNQPLIPEA